jgi:hypothetical protein
MIIFYSRNMFTVQAKDRTQTDMGSRRYFLTTLLLVAQAWAHRNGGPVEACRTLVPDHEGMEPLDGASSNYYLEVKPQVSML